MSSEASASDSVQLIDAVDDSISTVRTRQLDISFNELADMHESGELIIKPEYQRLFRWTEGAQSRFIETLMLELPVPPIFLMETEENVYELIDGLQRISSYLNFRGMLVDPETGEAKTPLVLQDCDIVKSLNGYTYATLPAPLSRRLKRNFIRAEVLRKENSPQLRYYMFKRLNAGGSPLEPQEIRNCTIRLLDSRFNDLLQELSNDENFSYCISTVAEQQIEKLYDQELILRFFAFWNWRDRYQHEVGEFLTEYMEAVSAGKTEESKTGDRLNAFDWDRDPDRFRLTFLILRKAAESTPKLAEKIFGSVDSMGRIRGQFAVYHFEGISLGIQNSLESIDPENEAQIQDLGAKLLEVKTNSKVREHTGGGKNTAPAFKKRLAYFAKELST